MAYLFSSCSGEAAAPPIYNDEDGIEVIKLYRYNHVAYRNYRALAYLLVKVRINVSGEVVSSKVAFCHNGVDAELDDWFTSGFHGAADVANVRINGIGDVQFDVKQVTFHYCGPAGPQHTLTIDPHLPGRPRECQAFHNGRKHKKAHLRIAPDTYWAIMSECTPETHHDYQKLLHFLLHLDEMPFSANRNRVLITL